MVIGAGRQLSGCCRFVCLPPSVPRIQHRHHPGVTAVAAWQARLIDSSELDLRVVNTGVNQMVDESAPVVDDSTYKR